MRLFGSIQSGLRRNPSVDGQWLLVYVHGLCVEFLHLSATEAAKSLLQQDAVPQVSASVLVSSAAEAAAVASLSVDSRAYLGTAAASVDALLPSRHAGKMQGIAVKSWSIRSGGNLDNGGSPTAPSATYVPLSGAHRQKGAGAAMAREDPTIVLPEPRVSRYSYASGAGRADKRFVNSGASSAADAPMGVFALTLFRNAVQVRLVKRGLTICGHKFEYL